jgi:hypothetical protein
LVYIFLDSFSLAGCMVMRSWIIFIVLFSLHNNIFLNFWFPKRNNNVTQK